MAPNFKLRYRRAKDGIYYSVFAITIFVFALILGYLNEDKPEEDKKPMLVTSCVFLFISFGLLLSFGILSHLGPPQ